jgi:FkbM family methyltransferase
VDLHDPAWRRHPLRTAVRVAKSLAYRHMPGRHEAIVRIDESGPSRMVADLTTALGLRLYRYGLIDPEMALVRRLLAPGDSFVDGGANVGLYTLLAAPVVGPTGRVIAFEPATATRGWLTRNVRLNGYDWVEVRSEALDATSSERSFVSRQGDAAGLSSFAPGHRGPSDRVETVVTIALDRALTETTRAKLALVKLDLEGAEVGALRGATELLREVGPDLLVEVEAEHLARNGSSAVELFDLLRAAGYSFFRPAWGERDEPTLSRLDGPTRPGSGPNVFASKALDRVRRAGVRVGD